MKTSHELVDSLETAGYNLSLKDGNLKYSYEGEGSPDSAKMRPLLAKLRAHADTVAKYIDYLTEPRTDLEEDSHLWRSVLEVARRRHPEVFRIFHGFRCLGAELVMAESGLKMQPRIHNGESPRLFGFDSREDYDELRERWLIPLVDEIIEVFDQVGEEGSGS